MKGNRAEGTASEAWASWSAGLAWGIIHQAAGWKSPSLRLFLGISNIKYGTLLTPLRF
jgi:hypothetical protein